MSSDVQSALKTADRGEEPYLDMTSISKTFGPIQALKNVDFEVRAGEVMALVGENGAGKSTLAKILAGIHRQDSGGIRINGREVTIHSPADSQELGIAVVQQELSLIPTLSVAENVFVGDQHRGFLLTPRKMREMAAPYLEQVGLADLDMSTLVGQLSVAERQLIEVARMVSRNARILILDEPTASLNDNEIERVKRVVRSLATEGRSIIYVTHRLAEVFDLANRVTVLRNGEGQPGIPISELTTESLVERMIGRSLQTMYPPRAERPGSEVLAVKDLLTEELRSPVGFTIRSGEILGLAGQVGSGVASVLKAIAGVDPIAGGQINLKGQPLSIRGRHSAISAGIAYCSADRKKDGLFQVRTVTENLTAPALIMVTPRGWVSSRREKDLSARLAKFFMIDPGRLRHLARTLSGGNQQKVALGKWLGIEPVVLMVEEPTRGVDVGARAEIYGHLRNLANEGLALVFASSDIQEVLGLADTIATFYHGRLINVSKAEETDLTRVTMEVTIPAEQQREAE